MYFKKNILIGALLLICAAVVPAPDAVGFTTFTGDTTANPSGFSNLITNPGDLFSWDGSAITYSFAPSFTTDARLRDQVRLAFEQWDNANGTPDGAIYSYNRSTGFQPFGDLRSIAVHEIGHAIGVTHPDQADAVSRNYGFGTAGGLVTTPDQNNEVMRSWINPGDYNQTLSHDELDAFQYTYGRDLDFTEVALGGDIVISSSSKPSSSTWATGGGNGVYRTGNTLGGVRFTSGFVDFNSTSSQPLGFKTLGINWDYENVSGDLTSSFEVRTRGTSNPDPIFHYDGFPANRFTNYSNSLVSANAKEDLLHTWSNPTGGPFAGIVHVGLEQDVWDWSVVSAQVVNPGGTRTNAPLLSFHDWTATVTGVASPAVETGDGIVIRDPRKIVGRGIRILNTLESPNEVMELAIADVDGMGLQLDDLNAQTLERLAKEGLVEVIDQFDPRTFDDGEEMLLLLDGDPGDFSGQVLSLDRPDLADRELLVFAKSGLNEALVGNYALVGRGPIIGIPEPTGLFLCLLAVLLLMHRGRKVCVK